MNGAVGNSPKQTFSLVFSSFCLSQIRWPSARVTHDKPSCDCILNHLGQVPVCFLIPLGQRVSAPDNCSSTRMNNGPVIGYEEDVGRRTTFRLSYPESIFSDPIHYDPNTTVVLIVFKPRDLKWLWEILGGQKISAKGFWKKPALNMIYKSSQIRILDPSITRKTAYEWLRFPTRFPRKEKPKHPTTGLIAITLAFHICHEVHLAGFKYDFTDRNSSLHYYGNDTMSQMMQNEYHNIQAEQKFLKKLIDKNFVVNLT
ncbi:type 2 lactosamine alpha-2,3-sialyltransferase isoform 3-T6 [Podargus strigoides]